MGILDTIDREGRFGEWLAALAMLAIGAVLALPGDTMMFSEWWALRDFGLREVTIALPRLVDRGDDLFLLAHYFLRQAESQFALPGHRLGDDTQAAMRRHAWPGNARELRATMRRAALLAEGPEIRPADLQLAGSPALEDEGLGDTDRPLSEARDAFTRRYIRAVLDAHDGNREATALALGIGERTLYRHLASES